jgi:hypothetical protein
MMMILLLLLLLMMMMMMQYCNLMSGVVDAVDARVAEDTRHEMMTQNVEAELGYGGENPDDVDDDDHDHNTENGEGMTQHDLGLDSHSAAHHHNDGDRETMPEAAVEVNNVTLVEAEEQVKTFVPCCTHRSGTNAHTLLKILMAATGAVEEEEEDQEEEAYPSPVESMGMESGAGCNDHCIRPSVMNDTRAGVGGGYGGSVGCGGCGGGGGIAIAKEVEEAEDRKRIDVGVVDDY